MLAASRAPLPRLFRMAVVGLFPTTSGGMHTWLWGVKDPGAGPAERLRAEGRPLAGAEHVHGPACAAPTSPSCPSSP